MSFLSFKDVVQNYGTSSCLRVTPRTPIRVGSMLISYCWQHLQEILLTNCVIEQQVRFSALSSQPVRFKQKIKATAWHILCIINSVFDLLPSFFKLQFYLILRCAVIQLLLLDPFHYRVIFILFICKYFKFIPGLLHNPDFKNILSVVLLMLLFFYYF